MCFQFLYGCHVVLFHLNSVIWHVCHARAGIDVIGIYVYQTESSNWILNSRTKCKNNANTHTHTHSLTIFHIISLFWWKSHGLLCKVSHSSKKCIMSHVTSIHNSRLIRLMKKSVHIVAWKTTTFSWKRIIHSSLFETHRAKKDCIAYSPTWPTWMKWDHIRYHFFHDYSFSEKSFQFKLANKMDVHALRIKNLFSSYAMSNN